MCPIKNLLSCAHPLSCGRSSISLTFGREVDGDTSQSKYQFEGETSRPFRFNPLECIPESLSIVHHHRPKVYSRSSGGQNQILRNLCDEKWKCKSEDGETDVKQEESWQSKQVSGGSYCWWKLSINHNPLQGSCRGQKIETFSDFHWAQAH